MCIFLLQSKPLRIFIATSLEAKIQKWRQPTRNATGLRNGQADKWRQPTRNATGLRDGHADNRTSE